MKFIFRDIETKVVQENNIPIRLEIKTNFKNNFIDIKTKNYFNKTN